jgi:hypothetical protein
MKKLFLLSLSFLTATTLLTSCGDKSATTNATEDATADATTEVVTDSTGNATVVAEDSTSVK